ncbi:MAG TPA: DUF308 domain-containing protein [Thermoleophilaceae bacterium]|nr:DUF308 domain-containing protein [Thermoleophilaceae bacterium]
MPNTFATPGTVSLGQRLTKDVAVRVARNWWLLLVNGLLLVVAGVLIFSIDWSVSSLATFIGALFIFEGISSALTSGIDARAGRANVVAGLLSAAAGIAIIVWPTPGIVAIAIFLGSWLIVVGTLTIGGAFAVRYVLPDWWLMLITGLLEVPLGVLALATPGATLAALITVGGIWAVAIGVMRIVVSFQVKRLPEYMDEALTGSPANGAARATAPRPSTAGPAVHS